MIGLRVLLIDESTEFLEAVEYFLKRDPRIEVVGRSRGSDGTVIAADLRPDLVLMDLAMPVAAGEESIRKVKELAHAPKVIVLTMFDYSEYRAAANAAGADGLLHKGEIGRSLLPMINQILPVRNQLSV